MALGVEGLRFCLQHLGVQDEESLNPQPYKRKRAGHLCCLKVYHLTVLGLGAPNPGNQLAMTPFLRGYSHNIGAVMRIGFAGPLYDTFLGPTIRNLY